VSGRLARRDRRTEPAPLRHRTRSEALDPLVQLVICGDRQIETLLHPMRTHTHHPALQVEDRAAGRATTEGGRVLQTAGDPASTGAAERSAKRGDRPHRCVEAPATGVRQRHDELAELCRRVGPGGGGYTSGVDGDHRQVTVDVGGNGGPDCLATVGELDDGFGAAQIVRVRDHQVLADNDAGALAIDGHDGRSNLLSNGPDYC
jgi:hypothetical protein